MRHVMAFDGEGALLLCDEVRAEAHGGVLWSLPTTDAEGVGHTFSARGDVARVERTIVRGGGTPAEGVERQVEAWRQGELLLSPEAGNALRWAHAGGGPDAHLTAPWWEPIADIRVMPLRTPTLPPATHTNAFVIGGREVLLVEPASPDPAESDALVDALASAGLEVRAIALTHHHMDHVGGASYLSQRLKAPLWAHEATATALPHLTIERHLNDGEELCIGDKTLRIINTPGHARGHLCFADEEASLLIAGDMVAGVGTILVEPGDGDMNVYLTQLERLAGEGLKRLIPAHGGLALDGPGLLRGTRNHRLRRDAKVRSVLCRLEDGGPVQLEALLRGVYDDVPEGVLPLARLSLLAHLEGMEARGEATRADGSWTPIS